MSAPGWDAQKAQIGFETTPGVAVATDKLTTMGQINITPVSEQQEVKASGDLHPTIIVSTKESSEWEVQDGLPCYRHLVYWSAMVYGRPIVEDLGGGAFRYTYLMARKTSNVLTATIAMGDDDHAIRVKHALATAITIGFGKQAGTADMAVSGFASDIDHEAALVANPQRIVPAYISPVDIFVSIADTLEDLDSDLAIKDNVYAVELDASDRFAQFSTFQRGNRSYNKTITTAPSATLTVEQLSDADSREWSNRYRQSRTAYVKVDAEGAEIVAAQGDAAAIHQALTIRAAIQAAEQVAPGEDDDAVVISTEGTIVTDAAGFSSSIEIVSDVAPLSAWLV